jgi:PAS domain-containing protein
MKDKTKTRKNRSGQKNAAGRIKIPAKDYRAILDAAGDGIFLYDIDRDETIAVNEKAREMLGNPEGNITFTALPFIREGESPWTREAALHHLRNAR